jgi:hypothetical protein
MAVHPFRTISMNFVYALSQLTPESIVIEGVGHQKVIATQNFKEIKCDDFYKDCFNFLSIKRRKLEVWSNNPKIKSVSYDIDINDEREPHKHPVLFTKEISRGEEFDWFYKTTYFLRVPTSELIDETRKQRWWDSKTKPIFLFFWHIKDKLEESKLEFYCPQWLGKYNYSKTYEEFDFDVEPVGESKFTKNGVKIIRKDEDNVDPRKSMPEELKQYFEFIKNGGYFRTSAVVSSEKVQEKSIIVTVGLLMPPSREWKK